MKKSIKLIISGFLFFLLFLILTLLAMITTETGNKLAYLYLGDRISQKAHFEVKVRSLDFSDYPEFTGELLLADEYTVNIYGILSLSTLDLQFAVTSNCISSNLCSIEDDVAVGGKIYGKFKDFIIEGEGQILDGTVTLNAVKKRHNFENIDVVFTDVNSSKFFTALKQKPLLEGSSNIDVHFDTLGKRNIQGQLIFHAKDNVYTDINTTVTLDTKVYINNKKYTFDADMLMPSATIQVREGKYNQATRYGTANYALDIKELADIKQITKVDAIGPFYASGKLILDKKIKMKGFSESFGGILDIAYEKKKFHLIFNDVPFNTIMKRLKQQPLLDAKMLGTLDYDVAEKEMHTKVKLKEVKFLQKELNDLVQEKFGHNLTKEVFPNSTFEASFKEDVLSSYLKIANGTNHFIFKDTDLNAVEHSIDTTINFQIQGHNIEGELYARNDGYSRHTLDTYLTFDGLVEKHYKVKLYGPLSRKWINMDYELSAARLPSHLVTIEDDINITGHLYGPYTRLYIRGEGTALDGKINFDTLKVYNELKDLNIYLTDIRADKLYVLSGLSDLPIGKATVEAHFKYLSKEDKKGTVSYSLRDAHYETLPLTLSMDVNVSNTLHTFKTNIDLNRAKITIHKGSYDESEKSTHASFILDIQNLAQIEALLGHKYHGPFYATGTLDYKDAFKVRGLSKTFGGTTDFLYKGDVLYVDFINASFKNIMKMLDYPNYLDASTNGSINYDFKKELLLVNTKLDNAKFLQSDFVEKAYDKAGINLLYETFDASELKIKYQHNVITGSIKLSNLKNHIYLTNALINTKEKNVNAYFDVHVQNREFSGKIYGSLDKPKVNLDMQRLIQHEMDRQIDSMGGKAPRELMEGMPMGGVAKDVVTGTAGSFMGIFF